MVAGDRALVLLFLERTWPHLCGAENLVHRFRTECVQVASRELPVWEFCQPIDLDDFAEWWPHLCWGWEVLATMSNDGRGTLGLCWMPGSPVPALESSRDGEGEP